MGFFRAAFACVFLHAFISMRLVAGLLLLTAFAAHAETATLQHDNNGNIIQRTINPGTATQATTTYTYDPLNRLKSEAGPAKTQSFTYDENGNRLSDGAGNYTYETTSNRMSTRLGMAVTHDTAGNLTADGTGRTFDYNQAGQLYQVKQGGILLATYIYDFTGLRIAKVTTASAPQGAQTVIYEYDEQEHLISEISGTNAPLRSYAWRGDTPVAQIEHTSGGDKTLYFDPDHLNTPRAAMDETGKVVWRWESDAFGATLPNEDVDGDGNKTTINMRFGGYQYADVESGLYYNLHRYYNPATGQFTQADRLDVIRRAVNPLYAQNSEPMDLRRGLNQPYTYTSNNPVNRIDPSGLLGECPANMRPGPGNICLPDPGTNDRKECKTAECAAGIPTSWNPVSPEECSLKCSIEAYIAGSPTEESTKALVKAGTNSASTLGLATRYGVKKVFAVSSIFDIASCIKKCKDDFSCQK